MKKWRVRIAAARAKNTNTAKKPHRHRESRAAPITVFVHASVQWLILFCAGSQHYLRVEFYFAAVVAFSKCCENVLGDLVPVLRRNRLQQRLKWDRDLLEIFPQLFRRPRPVPRFAGEALLDVAE